jgi:hypothetical protein
MAPMLRECQRLSYRIELMRRGRSPNPRVATQRLQRLAKFEPLSVTGLTVAGRDDGVGAQVQAQLSALAYCRRFGIPYVHSPLNSVEHTTGADEVERWERLFGIGDAEERLGDRSTTAIEDYVSTPALWREPAILRCLHMHQFTDADPDVYSGIQYELRRKYAGERSYGEQGIARVAVHVRRGDVSRSTNRQRYVSTEHVFETIRRVSSEVIGNGLRPKITLYSQGSPGDFADITESLPVDLQLDRDPLWTMERLIEAEVLVTAKSSFSYVAALLSEGAIYYQPFWHKPMSGWTVL